MDESYDHIVFGNISLAVGQNSPRASDIRRRCFQRRCKIDGVTLRVTRSQRYLLQTAAHHRPTIPFFRLKKVRSLICTYLRRPGVARRGSGGSKGKEWVAGLR